MYFHEQEFLLTLDKVTQLSALTILKSQWYCSRQKIIRKPLKFKNMFHMLLIQRNKLKCSEGWKDTNQQLHKRSSQDLLRIPRCQGWAEHWPRMSGWRLRHSMQKPDRPWDPQSKPQSLLPGLRSRATEVLLPMQNQESAAATPSVLPVSPDYEEEKGTLCCC